MIESSGIERNAKLGVYMVGGRAFYLKPEAHIYATETDQPVSWQFNDVAFAKYNWTNEPELDLRELYRRRAEQLREQYDYIRLELSGGSDSVTVAFAFLLNNIHLDEVMYRYPAQLDKGVTNDAFNTKPENTLSERQFAAEPILKWIKTNYPKTKVTIQDYSENLLNSDYMRDESWIYTTKDWFQPGNGIKHQNFNTVEQIALADTGQSICALYGIDKPKVTLIDNEWYTYFVDVRAGEPNPVMRDYTNITSECFFWTPDMPEIPAKQAHEVKRWFDMPHNQHLKHIIHHANANADQRTTYENLIKTIIYPDFDATTWQTSKPTNSFYNEMDHWFHVNMAGTEIFSAWQSGLELLVNKIDKKYFVTKLDRPTGLVQYRSTLYHLGSEVVYHKPERKFKNNTYLKRNEEVKLIKDRKIKKIVF
jgi:hypothetical protein